MIATNLYEQRLIHLMQEQAYQKVLDKNRRRLKVELKAFISAKEVTPKLVKDMVEKILISNDGIVAVEFKKY